MASRIVRTFSKQDSSLTAYESRTFVSPISAQCFTFLFLYPETLLPRIIKLQDS